MPRLLVDLVGAEHASIPQVLVARVAASPDVPFVRHEGRDWSYAEGWEAARRFAGWLSVAGLASSGLRVASFLGKRPEALWVWLGTLAVGGLHVALNRAHRGAVLADLAARARAHLLVTEAAAAADLPPPAEAGIRQVLFVDGVPDGLAWPGVTLHGPEGWAEARPAEPRIAAPGDPAAIIYTSGTTGRSKAVLLPHNMFCRGAARLAESFGFRGDDVFHDWMPLSHVAGQLHMTMSAVLAGACLAQFPGFSRSRFWQQVAESRATVFAGFTNVLKLLLMAPPGPADADSTLRLGLIGYIPPDLQQAFERRFGVALLDTYGMTEAEPLTLPDRAAPRPGTSGRVSPDFEIAILDEADRPLPPGDVGRICLRPRVPGVMMLGYEGDEAATVAAWRNLWFHTSDLGRLDAEGYLTFVDRLRHAIRRGGENISSLEVEQIILAHPAVADCAVVGVPDPLLGEAVKAVVVPREGAALEPAALHAYCAGAMARFMVPRYIEVRESLPYSDVGKVKREALTANIPSTWDAEARAG